MQITLESSSGLERTLNITIPSEEIEKKVQAKLQKIAATVKMPGFRPGKVPFDVVKKNYAGSARAEILEDSIRDSYTEALRQEKLNPVDRPEIKIITSEPGENFVYTATLEIYPEVSLNDFSKIEVEKKIATVGDSDVDEMLEKMRKGHVEWQDVTDTEYKSKSGDQLTIEFTVKPHEPDEKIEPKTEKDVKFVLGDASMWVDFEKPLYDLKIGEETSYTLRLPDAHMDKSLAGKEADFAVKVEKICNPILPELDDAFATKMNIQEGGIAKLREEVLSHMNRELEGAIKGSFKQVIMEKVLDDNPVEAPKPLVENELKRQEQEWGQRFAQSKTPVEQIPAFPKEEYRKQAERNVSLGLLLSAIVKEHKIQVNPQDVNKKIEELVGSYYDNKEEMMNKLLSEQRYVAEIEGLLLEEKVVDYLASQVKVTDKNLSYQEVVAQK